MKARIILPLYILFSLSNISYTQDIIFLHHSIGIRLFDEGNVAEWIEDYNLSNSQSFNIVTRSYPDAPWEGNYPYDYWKLWVDGSCNSDDPDIECLNTLVSNYDMIIFKHCAPGAKILPNSGYPLISSDTKTIENYQLQYRALRSLFDSYPDTKFMVWTMPPLHRLATKVSEAERANEFVQWLKNDWLTEDEKPHPNIFIFDFYSLVAELDQNPTNGVTYCLKYDYELNHDETDSHPNLDANQLAGPIFAQAIVDAFAGDVVPVTDITVTGANGISELVFHSNILRIMLNEDHSVLNMNIYNIFGVLLYNQLITENNVMLDMSNYASGVYIIVLESLKNRVESFKVIIP